MIQNDWLMSKQILTLMYWLKHCQNLTVKHAAIRSLKLKPI
ncbi:hypothetical protein [Lacticaseibacillus zeae]|nr:hypothetical protein [Lacticaseibacillus zeae]